MRWRRKTKNRDVPPTAAKLERIRSDKLKREAQAIVRDLHEIRRENHFAEALKQMIEGDAP